MFSCPPATTTPMPSTMICLAAVAIAIMGDWVALNAPHPALPMGVLAVDTMTASRMVSVRFNFYMWCADADCAPIPRYTGMVRILNAAPTSSRATSTTGYIMTDGPWSRTSYASSNGITPAKMATRLYSSA